MAGRAARRLNPCDIICYNFEGVQARWSIADWVVSQRSSWGGSVGSGLRTADWGTACYSMCVHVIFIISFQVYIVYMYVKSIHLSIFLHLLIVHRVVWCMVALRCKTHTGQNRNEKQNISLKATTIQKPPQQFAFVFCEMSLFVLNSINDNLK